MHSKTLEQMPDLTSGFDSNAFSRTTLGSWQNLAAIIDHTILKPAATRDEVIALCHEAAAYGFACAMVNLSSTVMIFPFDRIRSGAFCCAGTIPMLRRISSPARSFI